MNFHPDAVFNNILHHNCEATPFIPASVSLDPESVHLQMEYIKQYIQDATSYYLVNTSTANTNLLDTADDTITYIRAFLQPCHYYPESPTTQDHLTPDISTEACAPTSATATASAPNASSPTNPLSNSTE